MRSPYKRRMDGIANAIAKLLDGVDLEDMAIACAAVIGDAFADMPQEHRARVRALVDETIAMQTGRKNAHAHH